MASQPPRLVISTSIRVLCEQPYDRPPAYTLLPPGLFLLESIRTISESTSLLYHHLALSRLSPKPFSLSKMIPASHLATCYYRYLIPARRIGTHRDITLSAIPTSLAALKDVGVLAAKLSYIAPIAGLLLQALTMRDEVKRYKIECKSVMRKLSRVASTIVNVSKMYGKHNLNEEDLPPSLFAILGSLQIELEKIERVLEKCSKNRTPTQGSIDEDQAMRWRIV